MTAQNTISSAVPARFWTLGANAARSRPHPQALHLDERQRKLIALLRAGCTDSSAASRLGVSPRTVTNILRSLMDRLGVDNRFQLGMALGALMSPDQPAGAPRGPGPLSSGNVRTMVPGLSRRSSPAVERTRARHLG
ncbi:helix-turn-helix transcriptional regulator [Streptomyces sp. NBC_00859]|uniref:helix-turn-helix domain-containing protein n=1 Tax=Streptomyces sp. NBC_00859 TaxID=2903682 RepID=UPI0038705C1D|nr:helix-turn-helix transcriptional regulator [Streptomyces sp. NBC_00859]WSZ86728.1 helix-turn-helix transcriptional regulator [Streptomyces sp. NBC_00859]